MSGIDRWGRRNFAYELKHRSEGVYVFIEVLATPEAVAEVDRVLSLADEVLRHRVIRKPDKVAKAAPESAADATAS